MRDIDKLIDEQVADIQKKLLASQSLKRNIDPLRELFETIDLLMPGKVDVFVIEPYCSPPQVIFNFKVDALIDIAPVLELIEKKLGKEFTSSVDNPDAGWRSYFIGGANWMRVDAVLTNLDDGEKCKRVVKGYQSVPTYEFKCE